MTNLRGLRDRNDVVIMDDLFTGKVCDSPQQRELMRKWIAETNLLPGVLEARAEYATISGDLQKRHEAEIKAQTLFVEPAYRKYPLLVRVE